MDAKIKPKSIRKAILTALADGAIVTIDDLQTLIDEPRTKTANNAHAALADSLIRRLRDDVTGNPAYQITTKGREYLASFAGEKAEVAAKSPVAESDEVDEQALQRISRAIDQVVITPGVKVKSHDESTPIIQELHHRNDRIALLESEASMKDADILKQAAEIARLTGELETTKATLELARLSRAIPEPTGFVVQRPVKPMMRFTKPEKAQAHALNLARLGQRVQVFALHPVGHAVPGSEWVPA